MQIKSTKTEALVREYTVTMTAQEIDKKGDEKLAEIAKTVKMPGFRPGKVPMQVVKSKYGKAVMGEVLEALVNESMAKVINDDKLRPAMRPKIEVKTFDEKEGLEYSMAIELLPEFKVADVDGIALEKLVAKPSDKEVEGALERVVKAGRTTKTVEEKRAAKKGDIVLIDFDGTVDGKPFPGMKGDDFELELGSKSFVDTFEDQLVGAKAGDEKTVKVTFPEDYGHDKLRGVKAVFEVKVKELREPVLPKIDDEYAQKLGLESAAKLKETVSQGLQGEYDQVARMNLKRALLDVLDEKHDFEVPPGMLEAEYAGIVHQVFNEPGHQHGPDCAHEHGTAEEREEFREIAERRVKLGLVLAEIGRANKIEVTVQEIQQAVINEARRYPGREREVFDYYQKNAQALEGLKAPVYEDKVVDFILDKAKVSEKQVSIEELTKASEQEPPKKAKKSGKKK
jgi:trigger factor